jgi:hypothetical protein
MANQESTPDLSNYPEWDINEPSSGSIEESPPWDIKEPSIKETAAKWIGKGLLIIFGASIFLILSIFLIIVLINCTEQANLLNDSLIKLLEGLAKFSSAVFTPLLAFVLGYYFGTGKKEEA